MRKLSQGEVLNLPVQPGKRFHVKLWRLFHPDPLLAWEGMTPLIVKRATRSGNRLVMITPVDCDWTEGGADDISPDGDVIVEDYKMEIFEVE